MVIDWTDAESIIAGVKRLPGIFEEEILASLEEGAAILVGKTADFAPTGIGSEGNLATSIVYDRPAPSPGGWGVRWGTDAEHAEVIEYGRAPGSAMPPIENIARWLWIKGPGIGFEFEDEEEAESMAFVVARKIGRVGFTSGPVPGLAGGTAWAMFSRGRQAAEEELDRVFGDCRRRIDRRAERAIN